MTAFPTRTTELRRHRSSAVAAFYLIVSIGCVTECVAASPATRIDAIRDLGVQVKLAVDRVEAGQGSDLTQVTRFDSLLAQLPPAAADGSADRSEAKRKAVEHLLSKLKILIAQGVGTTAAPMRAASSNLVTAPRRPPDRQFPARRRLRDRAGYRRIASGQDRPRRRDARWRCMVPLQRRGRRPLSFLHRQHRSGSEH